MSTVTGDSGGALEKRADDMPILLLHEANGAQFKALCMKRASFRIIYKQLNGNCVHILGVSFSFVRNGCD